jgi:hypothetical protein
MGDTFGQVYWQLLLLKAEHFDPWAFFIHGHSHHKITKIYMPNQKFLQLALELNVESY